MKLIGRGGEANIERFRREAAALERIESDHVVKVIEADFLTELGGRPYMVMELLSGRDVASWLRERKRFTPREVVGILAQAARGIEAAHEKGIVHRDIKPENLFLADDDHGRRVVKVLDFGLARNIGDHDKKLTLTGETLGTPLYMAPEQVKARGDIGPRTDVWSIGVVALEMLTGVAYFAAPSVPGILSAIMYAPMRPPSQRWPSLPPGIDAWFFRSCAREPEQRFASVREQIDALEKALGVTAAPRVVKKSTKRDFGVVRTVLGLAACAAAIGGLVVCAAPPEPAAPINIVVAAQPSATGSADPTVPSDTFAIADTAPIAPAEPCSPPYTFDAKGVKHYKPECISVSSTIQAPAGAANLTLVCYPTCDSVLLDGAAIGPTPIRRAVTVGKHTVVATSGSTRKTVSFFGVAGQTHAIRLSMQ
jgi:hypothetical protein